jgi:O-methyltransferase
MLKAIKSAIQKTSNLFGYEIVSRNRPPPPHYLMSDPRYKEIISAVQPFTMTSCERIAAIVDAARYISRRGIPGAIVECGVWRGGSMMAAALALLEMKDDRDLYLFDTFAGMTAPTQHDIDFTGAAAEPHFAASAADDHNEWCYASIEDVRRNLLSTGYPEAKCHFIMGDVLTTIPFEELNQIAVLRLDTDWYESTLHELHHLYPKLTRGGLLIIDDYGHWQGCHKAVEEYFMSRPPFMFAIDYTARMTIRP